MSKICLHKISKTLWLCLIFILLLQVKAKAQQRKLIYDVMRNGKIIGAINFVELVQGQKKFLSMTSDVKTRYIVSFSDNTSETAAYDDGIMVYSSYYQKQTGSSTTNKTTIATGQSYKLTDNGVAKIIDQSPIKYNMLMLYTNIPATVTKVYSANYQKLLDLKKISENKYRLTLPDGSYNYYNYNNGICSKVEVERNLFTLQFVLRN